MKTTVVAFAVAALTLAVASVSQAAPIAPLSSAVANGQNAVTQVQYWRHHHRHCWWGPYHRWHCRWW